jgi:hypothetical protein
MLAATPGVRETEEIAYAPEASFFFQGYAMERS